MNLQQRHWDLYMQQVRYKKATLDSAAPVHMAVRTMILTFSVVLLNFSMKVQDYNVKSGNFHSLLYTCQCVVC
jgi:hypothetical protein